MDDLAGFARPTRRIGRRALVRGVVALVSLGLLAGCGLDVPRQSTPPGPRRVGFLGESPWSLDAFREGMGELGYAEGQGYILATRGSENDYSVYAGYTEELVRLGVECIVIVAINSALVAKQANSTVPMAGGLMSYGVDRVDSYRHAATYVDKILKGAKPADLPMERPRKYELAVNLKTARAVGVTFPPSILGQATNVLQ